MNDITDWATHAEEEDREGALEAQAIRAGLQGKTVEDSAYECHMCGAAIYQDRREAYPGVQTCVDCQAELEDAINAF
ncbi:TraR/DksA C4-type zinc finger protein [Propionivibrio dicarboxylicus]|uniref:Transcriptional regulator, TraR/DksA family n=1 Tax=Propionivibrio dicarboxylicus TaxID=83767 RepID=A0A1G8LC84_9RHOO|nr:TraR/DksA C4-type zinc finger protein [Propionivibrio dicarboxylicus]SDI53057.1 transcriptional regulator, TraR/DksA family [Propionivibrio dicarboxylicus]